MAQTTQTLLDRLALSTGREVALSLWGWEAPRSAVWTALPLRIGGCVTTVGCGHCCGVSTM